MQKKRGEAFHFAAALSLPCFDVAVQCASNEKIATTVSHHSSVIVALALYDKFTLDWFSIQRPGPRLICALPLGDTTKAPRAVQNSTSRPAGGRYSPDLAAAFTGRAFRYPPHAAN